MTNQQIPIFDSLELQKEGKSYRAIRHEVVRRKQTSNSEEVHHPKEKIFQVKRVLDEIRGWSDLSILELFAGHGNLTEIYAQYGEVLAYEKKKTIFDQLVERTKDGMLVKCENRDSFKEYHLFVHMNQKFDVIDLDPYGFPNRFFPDIFLLIDNGLLFVTMPKPYVNILNGITQTHLISYYGEHNPTLQTIIDRIALWGLCHWRRVVLLDTLDLKSVWRFAFEVKKIKATDYTGVKNR